MSTAQSRHSSKGWWKPLVGGLVLIAILIGVGIDRKQKADQLRRQHVSELALWAQNQLKTDARFAAYTVTIHNPDVGPVEVVGPRLEDDAQTALLGLFATYPGYGDCELHVTVQGLQPPGAD
ncbi:MAG: hypothetical protein ACREJ2_02830 [Planctomycetota bacterium]